VELPLLIMILAPEPEAMDLESAWILILDNFPVQTANILELGVWYCHNPAMICISIVL
jgi:hypothetical protein